MNYHYHVHASTEAWTDVLTADGAVRVPSRKHWDGIATCGARVLTDAQLMTVRSSLAPYFGCKPELVLIESITLLGKGE